MDLKNILSEIDAHIAQLQQARQLLTDSSTPRKAGRPPKAAVVVKSRKPLSTQAKARIAAAQKARWAKVKKAAAVKKAVPAKKTPAKKAAAPTKAAVVKTA